MYLEHLQTFFSFYSQVYIFSSLFCTLYFPHLHLFDIQLDCLAIKFMGSSNPCHSARITAENHFFWLLHGCLRSHLMCSSAQVSILLIYLFFTNSCIFPVIKLHWMINFHCKYRWTKLFKCLNMRKVPSQKQGSFTT